VIPARPTVGLLSLALLVAVTGGVAVASRESPAVTRWQAFGQLAEPRALAVTVPLPSGDVLVVGGIDNDDPQVVRTTAELIDPFTGASRVLPQKLLGRVNHTATLAKGEVVLAGGTERLGTQWSALDRVEVFDPIHQTWTVATPMLAARSDHGAAALRDGRVLVAGGTDGPRQLASVEIYDIPSNSWTRVHELPEARSQFSIATLNDGRVLVAGGLVRGTASSSSVIYDPARDAWDIGPRMQYARVLNASVKLAGGDVLMIGGQRDGGGTAERYDARAKTFVFAGTLAQPRMLAAAVRIGDGRVLVVGGLLIDPGRESFIPIADAEIWDQSTNAWSEASDPSTARALGSFVSTQAGALWIGGAGEGEHALRSIERFTWR
jgi:N-acetylneuraminic acid mutarotase